VLLQERPPKPKAELDMDNLRISFADYVWCWYCVGPSAVVLWLTGVSAMLFRAWGARRGCVRPQAFMRRDGQGQGAKVPFEPERLVAKLLLESMQMVRYDAAGAEDESGADGTADELATFRWLELPCLDKQNELVMYGEMRVVLSLKKNNKRMVRATLDGEPLSATQAVTLIWFDTIFAFHVKLHAYANWSVNSLNFDCEYARRASTITVMYNYFGYTVFPVLVRTFHSIGLTSHAWYNVQPVIECGLKQGLLTASGTLALTQLPAALRSHSNLCAFIDDLRMPFLEEFHKERECFPHVNGTCLYIGSVLHSLDHTNMAWNVEDPLWLDTTDERFGHLAECGRFVRAGFVDSPPGICWPRNYSNAPEPFYKAVYKRALELNPRLADAMETTIIK